MKNNKGFTLVELLAVIVIMGILMMVAIPSVTRTIENSRKDTFVDIAKSYGNAVRTLWTSDNLTCNGVVSSAVDDGDYYILINSKESAKESLPVLIDQGGKSSWGNRDVNGYVRVNISTTAGVDNNGDGSFEVEPRRVIKFYVALSDGTHGLIDDDTLMMDELKRGNVVMSLSEDQKKKVELTIDDGKLDCTRYSNGMYSCTAVNPIKNITGVCVDDQTNVGVTGTANLKSFRIIDDRDYGGDGLVMVGYFEDGMTWREWIHSSYNTMNFDESFISFEYDGYFMLDYIDLDSVIEEKDYHGNRLAECVSPLSNIQIGLDGEVILAKDIKVNDKVVYYDFDKDKPMIGVIKKVFVHKNATNLLRYVFSDNSYLESTDYHPIYTFDGWKSYTMRNGYPKPVVGDKVMTNSGWKKIVKIETFVGNDDYLDFMIADADGNIVDNYFANDTLVKSAYENYN